MKNMRTKNKRGFLIASIAIALCCMGFVSEFDNVTGNEGCSNKKMRKNKKVIPFDEVEVPPVFEDCNSVEQDCERRNCVFETIRKVLYKNLEQVLAEDHQFMDGAVRLQLQFVVTTKGEIDDIRIKGGKSRVNEVFEKVISNMSKMTVGKQKEKKVKVLYQKKFLIIKEEKRKKEEGDGNGYFILLSEDYGQGDDGMMVDGMNPAHFDDCSSVKGTNLTSCTSRMINKFIGRKFNAGLGNDLGLSGTNRIYVTFKISKCGNIIDAVARGPHPRLEKEALRVVNLLPELVPATYKGNNVSTLYTLPIVFRVE